MNVVQNTLAVGALVAGAFFLGRGCGPERASPPPPKELHAHAAYDPDDPEILWDFGENHLKPPPEWSCHWRPRPWQPTNDYVCHRKQPTTVLETK